MLHMAQIDDSRCMVGVTIFFPLYSVFLAVITSFAMGISFARVVSIVSWMGGASLGVRGFNPMAVTLVAPILVGRMRYQTGIANDTFGNTSVAKTYWETKLARG